MSRKHLSIGGRRIPLPKCLLCGTRYFKQFLDVFEGRIRVPLCLACLFPCKDDSLTIDGEMDLARKKCEKKLREIFEKEPAFNPPKEKADGQDRASEKA